MKAPRKDCYECRAIEPHFETERCKLGKETRFIRHDHGMTDGHHIPLEHCPKPKTYAALDNCLAAIVKAGVAG